jgi:glycosyltransferase involved in cell wall biosynthesis
MEMIKCQIMSDHTIEKRDDALSPAAVIYTFSFAHHGSHSSFHRLAHYLSDQCVVDVTCRHIDRLPHRIGAALMHRWLKYGEYRLQRHLRSAAPRCVHYIHPETSLQQGWRWKGRHKFVLTVHQPRDNAERMRERCGNQGFLRGLQVADAVVATDPDSIAAYQAYAPHARLKVIPHGIDVEFFRPAPDSSRRPVILTVGNWLRDYECWARVVRAFSKKLPGVNFEVIANPDTIRKARAALTTHSARVRFTTGLSDLELRDAYSRAQLMFLPLTNAAANNAVLESLAMSLPLVITDLPASRFYVGTEAGRYIENADIDGCVSTLATLVNDPTQRGRMADAARTRAVAEFSWPLVADCYRTLYQSLLGGSD